MNYLDFATENARREFGPHHPASADKSWMHVKPLVWVCGWCDGAREKTNALIAAGNRVTTGICEACQRKIEAANHVKAIAVDVRKLEKAEDDCLSDDTPLYPRRKPTREEKLQALADSGIDTWAEYNQER